LRKTKDTIVHRKRRRKPGRIIEWERPGRHLQLNFVHYRDKPGRIIEWERPGRHLQLNFIHYRDKPGRITRKPKPVRLNSYIE